jgi:hypothetical protein
MGKFQVGSKVFVHADAAVSMTTEEGLNPGVPYEDFQPAGLGMKSTGKAIEIKGNSYGPLVVVLGEVSHEYTMKLDVAAMVAGLAQTNGDGFALFAYDVVVSFVRAGLPAIAWTAYGTIFEDIVNFDSSSGAQPKSDVKGKATRLTITIAGVEYDAHKLPVIATS